MECVLLKGIDLAKVITESKHKWMTILKKDLVVFGSVENYYRETKVQDWLGNEKIMGI